MDQKKSTRWGWVIFWLIFFWPIGLFLLIRKYTTDKSAMMSEKTATLSIIGWVLISIGVLGILGEFTSKPDSSIVVLLMFLGGGVLLIKQARKIKKLSKRYKNYIAMVVNQNEKSIDNIAGASALPYDDVIKDLQDMINKGYLKDAYIHLETRELVLKRDTFEYQNTSVQQQYTIQKSAVRCPGCGANNIVPVRGIQECEYCGTPVSN